MIPILTTLPIRCRHLLRRARRAPEGCWPGRIALADECFARALAARHAIEEATREAAYVGLMAWEGEGVSLGLVFGRRGSRTGSQRRP